MKIKPDGSVASRAYGWIDDRSPTKDDADFMGRVLVDDPANCRIKVVPLQCVKHFNDWMLIPDFG